MSLTKNMLQDHKLVKRQQFTMPKIEKLGILWNEVSLRCWVGKSQACPIAVQWSATEIRASHDRYESDSNYPILDNS